MSVLIRILVQYLKFVLRSFSRFPFWPQSTLLVYSKTKEEIITMTIRQYIVIVTCFWSNLGNNSNKAYQMTGFYMNSRSQKTLILWCLIIRGTIYLNPFQSSIAFYTETSYLICCANQMTGFYMKCYNWLKWVKLYTFLNPLMTNVPHHIETIQLIRMPNQLTGFYMMGNIGR